jgi:hypothetical protein
MVNCTVGERWGKRLDGGIASWAMKRAEGAKAT